MAKLKVASQIPTTFEQQMAAALPEIEFVHLDPGALTGVPNDVPTMIAIPFPSTMLDMSAPAGWPFDLQWIHLLSAGLDKYPRWLFDGPPVTYSPGAAAVPLAEFALASIFAAAKRLPEVWVNKPAQWTHRALDDVAGSALGIVGFGATGEALAQRALALGMNVQAIRQSARPLPQGVHRAESLSALFATSDHVVLALPATDSTIGMIDRDILRAAKPGLHLVNLARGAIIDDAALLDALDDGPLRLASLDVTEPEPLPAGHIFYSHPRIRLSPHTSGSGGSTWAELIRMFGANVARFLAGAPLLYGVSPAPSSPFRPLSSRLEDNRT